MREKLIAELNLYKFKQDSFLLFVYSEKSKLTLSGCSEERSDLHSMKIAEPILKLLVNCLTCVYCI